MFLVLDVRECAKAFRISLKHLYKILETKDLTVLFAENIMAV